MRIGRLPAPGSDVQRWSEIYTAGRAPDSGNSDDATDVAARINAEPEDPDTARFGAWLDGHLIGAADASRNEKSEIFARVFVEAPHRRQGAGRGLAAAVVDWAAQRGCPTVTATLVAGTPGEDFAEALGSRVAIRLVAVVRHLDTPAPSIPAPAGLRLIRWTNHTPEELLDASVVLRRAVGDAPDAHLQINVETRTPQWVREWERARTSSGNELRVCAAVDVETSDLVGFTEAEVPMIGVADQHDSAVLPAWRGQGVGTWLKADMIDWLRADRPLVDRLTSTINQQNVPMLRVCAVLGFREEWRRHLVTVAVPSRTPPDAGRVMPAV